MDWQWICTTYLLWLVVRLAAQTKTDRLEDFFTHLTGLSLIVIFIRSVLQQLSASFHWLIFVLLNLLNLPKCSNMKHPSVFKSPLNSTDRTSAPGSQTWRLWLIAIQAQSSIAPFRVHHT